jgi:protein-L-isoaspartate(D-aspartate) O-methyltransferase
VTITAEHSAEGLRHRLTDYLVAEGVLRSSAWRRAFATVPREHFVPAFSLRTAAGPRTVQVEDPTYLETVYSDASLIIERDAAGIAISSSSQPRVMAAMLQALPDDDHTRVLEIGTGTGYNAALLSARYGSPSVATLDVEPALTSAARARLISAGYTPTVVTGDGTLGHEARAPYNAIIVTCGLPRIPAALLAQLTTDGTLVANLGYGLAALHRRADGSLHGRFLREMAAFMAARHAPGDDAPNVQPRSEIAALLAATGTTTAVRLPYDVTAPMARFLGSVIHPDTEDLTLTDESGHTVHTITQPATGAWARLTQHSPDEARVDFEGRDLWAERFALIDAWSDAGRPGPEQYGLTVTPDGGHTLWLDAPDGASWKLP